MKKLGDITRAIGFWKGEVDRLGLGAPVAREQLVNRLADLVLLVVEREHATPEEAAGLLRDGYLDRMSAAAPNPEQRNT